EVRIIDGGDGEDKRIGHHQVPVREILLERLPRTKDRERVEWATAPVADELDIVILRAVVRDHSHLKRNILEPRVARAPRPIDACGFDVTFSQELTKRIARRRVNAYVREVQLVADVILPVIPLRSCRWGSRR